MTRHIEKSVIIRQDMNPANHGQCHIRRNSRDERSEGLLSEEHHGQPDVTQVWTRDAEQPSSHQGEERRPLLAEQFNVFTVIPNLNKSHLGKDSEDDPFDISYLYNALQIQPQILVQIT